MELKPYLQSLPNAAAREAFATRCGTSIGHLNNVANGYNDKKCSTELAVAIELESCGVVTRQELCPDNWQARWPELRPQQVAQG
jgi:DNA-binding transcriptional regulator YdaS (Cro superfamily)